MGIWLVSCPALQPYKQAEGSGMVQQTHRASSASPHNSAEALGTDEAVIGSMGPHKGSLWHCNVVRRPAGLCVLVGHFHLCSLSWQLVTCQHCPNPCCTLRGDRQQRAVGSRASFPRRGYFSFCFCLAHSVAPTKSM